MKKPFSLKATPVLPGRIAAAATALLLFAGSVHAAISVGPTGVGPLTFDATPAASEFATGVLLGTATTFTDAASMDAGVAGVTASSIVKTLPTSGTQNPPSTFSGGFRHNTAGFYIQSRPTTDGTNAANVLLATLQNNSGANRSAVVISYDFNLFAPATGQLPGFNVYYSLTGDAGSWQPIPELTGNETVGNKSASLALGSWPVGGTLYILWADDNADAITDPAYTIDNFLVAFGIDPPVITQQPVSTTNIVARTVSLTVAATGIGVQYQWHKVGVGPINPIDNPSAATATLVITNAQLSDTGDYFVVVSNQGGGVTSQNAHIQINPDTAPPRLLKAEITATGFRLTVDEPLCTNPDPTTGCGSDASFAFNWEVQDSATGIDLSVGTVTINGTNVDFTTLSPAESGKTYKIVVSSQGSGISDLFGNLIIPDGNTFVQTLPTATFQQNVGGYTGTQDTELRGAAPDTAQGSATGVTVDTSDGGGISDGLLRFDNIFGGNTGQVPLGAEIISATLTLQHNVANANGNPVNLHRMLIPWDAATATYNSFVDGVQADGIEAMTNIDVVVDSTGRTVPFTMQVDVTTSVRAWAAGSANFGWAFIPTGTDGYRWDTSESTTPPALSIIYRIIPCTNSPSFSTQPLSVTNNEGANVTLSAGVATCGATSYQWSKNNVDIPGATSASLSLANLVPGDEANYRLRVTNPNGTATSNPAFVDVVPDTTRPLLTSATPSSDGTTIRLTFSKPLAAASAQNTANYTFTPSLAVSSAVLSNGSANATVVLTTAARSVANAYTLRIQGVTDTRVSANLINPNPTLVPITTVSVIDAWNSTWLYNTNNLDATLSATPWYSPAYTPGADWQTGNALFGIETSAGIVAIFPTPIATPLLPNTNTPPDITAFYFRRQITLPAIPAGTTYAINHFIDDGAIFYLDGVVIGRLNMTNAQPTLYAQKASTTGEAELLSTPFTAAAGSHLLAVEVHQGGATTSSDVLFGAQIIAIRTASPQLTISHAGTNVLVNWSADSSWQLHEANVVTGPYNNVLTPTAFGSYLTTPPTTPTNHFFRLQYRPVP